MFEVPSKEPWPWLSRAECNVRKEEVQALNQMVGYDIFYPEKTKTEAAKRLSDRFCRVCPVQVECFAAGREEAGTWGGETFKKRKQMVRTLSTSLSGLLTRMQEQSQGANTLHNEESGHGLAS